MIYDFDKSLCYFNGKSASIGLLLLHQFLKIPRMELVVLRVLA